MQFSSISHTMQTAESAAALRRQSSDVNGDTTCSCFVACPFLRSALSLSPSTLQEPCKRHKPQRGPHESCRVSISPNTVQASSLCSCHSGVIFTCSLLIHQLPGNIHSICKHAQMAASQCAQHTLTDASSLRMRVCMYLCVYNSCSNHIS